MAAQVSAAPRAGPRPAACPPGRPETARPPPPAGGAGARPSQANRRPGRRAATAGPGRRLRTARPRRSAALPERGRRRWSRSPPESSASARARRSLWSRRSGWRAERERLVRLDDHVAVRALAARAAAALVVVVGELAT